MNPFDIVKHLQEKTDVEVDMKDYIPYIINHAMSNSPDCLVLAEYMNRYAFLDKEMQYDFYYHGLPTGKRYGKWHKPNKSDEEILNIICELFECNERQARKFLTLFDDETREQLLKIRGGR